jgi:hypothetical protein
MKLVDAILYIIFSISAFIIGYSFLSQVFNRLFLFGIVLFVVSVSMTEIRRVAALRAC